MTEALNLDAILNEVLFGASQKRISEIDETMRFVHYTSADAAMKIIQGIDGKNYFWQLSPCIRLEGVAYNMYEHESPNPSPVS